MENGPRTAWHENAGIRTAGEPQGGGRSVALQWRQLAPSLRYVFSTEAHAYSFSIAANALLSFFPFALILLTLCGRWLHWEAAYQVIVQLIQANLPSGPSGADFVVRSLNVLVQGHRQLQLVSVLAFLFTSSGIFLPLEVALNRVWGFEHNRSFLRNQAVSFLLAGVVGSLALASVVVMAASQAILSGLLGWLQTPIVIQVTSRGVLEVFSFPLAISLYLSIYYLLPNGRIAVRRALPAAVVAGVLTTAAKFLYKLTLPLFRFREVYGPFTLSVTLLFWAYLVALILLFGAHLSAQGFNQHDTERPPGNLRSNEGNL